MNTVKIVRIPILPMHMVNSHLLVGPDGCILIDAGLPGSENKIKKALAKERLTFKDIKLIVVTHAHVDHAGSAAVIRELSGAPILAHEGDAKHFNRETPMTFCPTGWFGRLFIKTPLMLEPYIGFEPDILLTKHDVIDLERYGVPGMVKHTPGHTVGSVSIELASNEALVGDLVASGILLGGIVRTNRAIRPPFEDDPHTVARELTRLLDSGIEKFYMGHGGPLKASEIQRHTQSLMMLPKK
ncbi:hydroxyacylglutathione hydrolase [Paenibacillus sp. V4I3]|uniref:MBL fold metallo-hydrolase n=1 Tax=unclassified Paenibacillus TaxID=185978 RepID=UPI00278A9B95|nr:MULTISPECIES: MBL fold metallo-hydrolase [unclassified Paenibacillus]MDQ0871431.1 hydroxyacylglutathione hydrolase [Paenibacillus sp. V4I3]MDQ0885255.1 hydroxyacylglutathione hydrolase [Paenibacillus sp. V4I9]